MRVEKYDGPTRFLVQASTPGDAPYLVELEAYGLVGKCACAHFEHRLKPELEAGTRGPKLRCKHILAARNSFAADRQLTTDEQVDQVLREYATTHKTAQENAAP